jgi:hypothetical protein
MTVKVIAAFVYGDEGSGDVFQRFTISLELEESMVILLHTLVFCPHNSDPSTPDIQCSFYYRATTSESPSESTTERRPVIVRTRLRVEA